MKTRRAASCIVGMRGSNSYSRRTTALHERGTPPHPLCPGIVAMRRSMAWKITAMHDDEYPPPRPPAFYSISLRRMYSSFVSSPPPLHACVILFFTRRPVADERVDMHRHGTSHQASGSHPSCGVPSARGIPTGTLRNDAVRCHQNVLFFVLCLFRFFHPPADGEKKSFSPHIHVCSSSYVHTRRVSV